MLTPVTTVTLITIQVIMPVTMSHHMPVIQPLFIMILIQLRQLLPLQLPQLQQRPVTLGITAYLIPTIINDKRPFTPCDLIDLSLGYYNKYW